MLLAENKEPAGGNSTSKFNELNVREKLFSSCKTASVGRILARARARMHVHVHMLANCIPVHQQTAQTGWPPTGSFNRKQPDERCARDLLRITPN